MMDFQSIPGLQMTTANRGGGGAGGYQGNRGVVGGGGAGGYQGNRN